MAPCVKPRGGLLFSRQNWLEEALDEQRNIFFAIAERRQLERDHVEAVKQVLAEAPVAHQLHQIFVRCRQDANVDFDCFRAAEPHELALLNHAQELGLRFRADGRNFVEENRALIRHLEQAFFRRNRARERALHVTEELRFEQIDGNRAGVDGDEGFLRARRSGMNRFRDQFLSGAAFAGDQHGGARRRHLRHEIEDASIFSLLPTMLGKL